MSRQRTYRVGETISRPANPAPNFVTREGAQAPVTIFLRKRFFSIRFGMTQGLFYDETAVTSRDSRLPLTKVLGRFIIETDEKCMMIT